MYTNPINRIYKGIRPYIFFFALFAIVAYVLLLSYRYFYFRKSEVVISYNTPSPSFFCWPNSYQVGDLIQIHAHSTSPYRVKIGRVGKDSISLVHTEGSNAKNKQTNRYSLKYGCDWSVTNSLSLEGYSPGLYLIELNSIENKSWVSPVLVRSKKGNDIVVVSPTNTWQAYNSYGGKSNYIDLVTPKDVKYLNDFLGKISSTSTLDPYNYLPQKRPYLHELSKHSLEEISVKMNGKITSDLYLIEYLEFLGLKYDIISDSDFEKGVGIDNAKIIVFHNHSEYWSYEGIGMLKQMIKRGKNILFLSGNNMYREVESIKGNTLIVMEQATDRKAIEPILGTYYSESGYDMPYGSYKVLNAEHWIFKGTNLKNGDLFGEEMISGIETDKLGPYSEGFDLLAIGNNQAGPAHFVYKAFDQGNFIINSSSIASVRALENSAEWRQIVKNILHKGLEQIKVTN